MNTLALVLAAGSSSRLGRAKQLLRLPNGRTLIEHACVEVEDAGATPLVVLGACAEEILDVLGERWEYVLNSEWQQGMGHSLATGVKTLRQRAPDRILVALVDQPGVVACNYRTLIKKCADDVDASAAFYKGRRGVPVCFGPTMFDALTQCKADKGARELLRASSWRIQEVPLEVAALDVDSETAWQYFLQGLNKGDRCRD